MRSSDKLSGAKGFTLSELMLTASILVLALSLVLLLFISCIFLNEASRNISIASSHAQYLMEEMKSTSFANIVATYNGVCLDRAAIIAKGLSALSNEAICTTVTGTTMLSAAVTVTWRDRGSRNRSLVLDTLITEP